MATQSKAQSSKQNASVKTLSKKAQPAIETAIKDVRKIGRDVVSTVQSVLPTALGGKAKSAAAGKRTAKAKGAADSKTSGARNTA